VWLTRDDANKMSVTVYSLPIREQIDTQVREQLIVELYSK
jgi:ribosomal protein S4